MNLRAVVLIVYTPKSEWNFVQPKNKPQSKALCQCGVKGKQPGVSSMALLFFTRVSDFKLYLSS